MTRYGLPSDTEIHANPCLLGHTPFSHLNLAEREQLLWDFMEDCQNHYLFHYPPAMFKSLVPEQVRASLTRRGLSQYETVLLAALFVIGNYLSGSLGVGFKVVYDADQTVGDKLRTVAGALRNTPNAGSCVTAMVGEPQPWDSRRCAAIQLADVIAHYHDRHHRIYYGRFDHGTVLEQHKEKIARVYNELLRHKEFLPFSAPMRRLDWSLLGRITLER